MIPENTLREAAKLIQEKNKPRAVQLLTPELCKEWNNANIWWLLANAMPDQSRKRVVLQQVLRIQPKHQNASAALANLPSNVPEVSSIREQLTEAARLLEAGEKAQAAQMAIPVLCMDSKHVAAWWLLANTIPELEQRACILDKILSLKPDHEKANAMKGRLNNGATKAPGGGGQITTPNRTNPPGGGKGEITIQPPPEVKKKSSVTSVTTKKSESSWEERAASLPDTYKEKVRLGIEAAERNEFDEAIQYYTEAIRIDPKFPDAYTMRGMIFEKLNLHERAQADYSKYVELGGEINASFGGFVSYYRPAVVWFIMEIIGIISWIFLFTNPASVIGGWAFAVTILCAMYRIIMLFVHRKLVWLGGNVANLMMWFMWQVLFVSLMWPPVQFVQQGYFLIRRWLQWKQGIQYVDLRTLKPVRMA